MSSNRTEFLMQRCVDNELNVTERRELFDRMDEYNDGWKELACSFMEDQMFAGAVRKDSIAVAPPTAVMKAAEKKQHWFHHPMMSLALSACVAFLGGVLISREMQQDGPSNVADGRDATSTTELAANDAVGGRVPSANNQPGGSNAPGANLVSDGGYRARVEPYGMPAQEMPVYDANEYATRSMDFWQSMSRQNMAERSTAPESRIRYLRLKGADGQTYVFPVQENAMPMLMQ